MTVDVIADLKKLSDIFGHTKPEKAEKLSREIDLKISSLYTKSQLKQDLGKSCHYLSALEFDKAGTLLSGAGKNVFNVLSLRAKKFLTDEYFSGHFRYNVDDHYDPKYRPDTSKPPFAVGRFEESSNWALSKAAQHKISHIKTPDPITAIVGIALTLYMPKLTAAAALAYGGYQAYQQLG